ncbi:Metal-dependent hydrolase, beta-lactamase superfamily II [Reichenbachiella faecimaris]|uniref:Metal-dependent hydrolase, beta-lactamase superfamily II n=1 Tax=Reichenbachiella faecimaris TaxID=692418 RepID=A0A1W2GHB7_REIFA|nr:MBL fold metallo-hydrolase [Reichenbachiella faecimaris]SMD36063.1 Metal-dependent hydrolase, beta-lactamase superfamily II [Reichenbachiella faecimaris]
MQNVLTIICWDVQHGNALFIKTPGGHSILSDLGKGSYSSRNTRFSPVNHILTRSKPKHIDLLILTHPHKDHIEDILSLNRAKVNRVILPVHLSKKDYLNARIRSVDKPIFEEYHRYSQRSKTTSKINFDEVKFSFFYPKEAGRSRLNDHSVVTVISHLNFRLVLMGDNESFSQKELLDNASFRKLTKNCDMLLAPHHGRRSGFVQSMIDHLNPQITIISDGTPRGTSVRNKYATGSRGIDARSRNGIRTIRRALSTNKDGVIKIEVGTYRGQPHMKITTKPSGS